MESKSTEFTRVTTKKTGTIRTQNSLHRFVLDNPRLSCLKDYDLHFSSKATREAIFACPKASQAAEPTFTTFRGCDASNPHLSIDSIFSLENARHAEGFGPAHVTVSYGEFRLHVYYNHHGKRIDLQVRSEDGRRLALKSAEEASLLEQIAPLEGLLEQLILKKQEAYLDLSRYLFELEESLSKARTKEEYFEIREEYLAQLKIFNSYSDTVEVRQPRCILQAGAHFNVGAVGSSAAAADEGGAADAGEDEAVMLKTVDVSPVALGRPIDALKATLSETVDAVIDGCAQGTPLSSLIPMLIEIDELALLITFESKKEKTFLRQEMTRLPLKLSDLKGQFEEKLKAGDVDYIQTNYVAISGVVNLVPMFFEFLSALPEQQSSPELLARQLEIADYLYEHSEIYRSVFLLKNMSFSFDEGLSVGYGFLIDFFKQKNLLGFEMLLRHGISLDGAQMLSQQSLQSHFLNALQVVTFLYITNPDIRFIDLLLAYQAPMRMTQQLTCAEAEISQNPRSKQPKFVLKEKGKKGKSVVSKQALSGDMAAFQQQVQNAAEINHALELAVSMKSAPLLIDRLAGAADSLQLLQVFTALVTKPPFTTRVVVKREASDLTMLVRFFIPPEFAAHSDAAQRTGDISQILSKHLTERFDALDEAAKREIILTMDTLGTQSMKEEQTVKAYESFRAAQLAYSLLEVKTHADHKAMYGRYLKLSQVVESSDPDMAQSEADNSRIFLEQWKKFKEDQAGTSTFFNSGEPRLAAAADDADSASCPEPGKP